MTTHICDLTPSGGDPESARDLLYRHALPEDVIDGVLCLHAQELATVQRREAAVWGVDTAAGKHILGAADLIDPTRTQPAAPEAVPPTDRAAALTEAERTMLTYALDQAQEKIWSEDGFADEDQAAVTSLRRLAAETPGPETQARRGDEFEQWLKAQRDLCFDYATTWGAVDGLLDQYRLHADTGTPLSEHVCEGRVAGDCDCLETPDTEPPDAPRREPHPTEADLRHALAVAAKFHGRDATVPVDPAASRTVEYRHTCHDQTSAPGRDYECQWCSTLPESLPAVVAEPGEER